MNKKITTDYLQHYVGALTKMIEELNNYPKLTTEKDHSEFLVELSKVEGVIGLIKKELSIISTTDFAILIKQKAGEVRAHTIKNQVEGELGSEFQQLFDSFMKKPNDGTN